MLKLTMFFSTIYTVDIYAENIIRNQKIEIK